jgi:hypothetical protein
MQVVTAARWYSWLWHLSYRSSLRRHQSQRDDVFTVFFILSADDQTMCLKIWEFSGRRRLPWVWRPCVDGILSRLKSPSPGAWQDGLGGWPSHLTRIHAAPSDQGIVSSEIQVHVFCSNISNCYTKKYFLITGLSHTRSCTLSNKNIGIFLFTKYSYVSEVAVRVSLHQKVTGTYLTDLWV